MKPVNEMTDAELEGAKAAFAMANEGIFNEHRKLRDMIIAINTEQKSRRLEAYWQAHPELERIEEGEYGQINISDVDVDESGNLVIEGCDDVYCYYYDIPYEEALEQIKRGSK